MKSLVLGLLLGLVFLHLAASATEKFLSDTTEEEPLPRNTVAGTDLSSTIISLLLGAFSYRGASGRGLVDSLLSANASALHGPIHLEHVHVTLPCSELRPLQAAACSLACNSYVKVLPDGVYIEYMSDSSLEVRDLNVTASDCGYDGIWGSTNTTTANTNTNNNTNASYINTTSGDASNSSSNNISNNGNGSIVVPALPCLSLPVSNWSQVRQAVTQLQPLTASLRLVLTANMTIEPPCPSCVARNPDLPRSSSGGPSYPVNCTCNEDGLPAQLQIYRNVTLCANSNNSQAVILDLDFRESSIYLDTGINCKLTIHHLTVIKLPPGPAKMFVRSAYTNYGWFLGFTRCSAPWSSLVFSNSTLVIPDAELSYMAHWWDLAMSPIAEDVTSTAWLGTMDCGTMGNLPAFKLVQKMDATGSAWLAVVRQFPGLDIFDSLFTSPGWLGLPDYASLLPYTSIFLDQWHPLPYAHYVYDAASLIQVLKAPRYPDVVLVANISVPPESLPAGGIDIPMEMYIHGWPGRPTVLDMQGASGVFRITQRVVLHNLWLMNTGVAPAGTYPERWVNNTMLWSFSFDRSRSLLELRSSTLVLSLTEAQKFSLDKLAGRDGVIYISPDAGFAQLAQTGNRSLTFRTIVLVAGITGYNVTFTPVNVTFDNLPTHVTPVAPYNIMISPPPPPPPPQPEPVLAAAPTSSNRSDLGEVIGIPLGLAFLAALVALVACGLRHRRRARASWGGNSSCKEDASGPWAVGAGDADGRPSDGDAALDMGFGMQAEGPGALAHQHRHHQHHQHHQHQHQQQRRVVQGDGKALSERACSSRGDHATSSSTSTAGTRSDAARSRASGPSQAARRGAPAAGTSSSGTGSNDATGSSSGTGSNSRTTDAGRFRRSADSLLGSSSSSEDALNDPFLAPCDTHSLLINQAGMSRDLQQQLAAEGGGGLAEQLHTMVARMQEELGNEEVVLERVIGQGASGVVYEGQWRGMRVACKTVTFTRVADQPISRKLHSAMNEVAVCRSLQHNNIVNAFGYHLVPLQPAMSSASNNSMSWAVTGMDGSSSMNTPRTTTSELTQLDYRLVLIQEFCEGGTLRDAIDDARFMERRSGNEAPPWADNGGELAQNAGPVVIVNTAAVLQLATDIAAGMSHIHSRNIIHSDLSPANILLKTCDYAPSRCVAKVADFGLALKLTGAKGHVSNMQRGTWHYIAPEVVGVGRMSKAADVYSFGVVLHEMWHGTPEWRKRRHAQSPRDGQRGRSLELLKISPDCHEGIKNLIISCTQYNPADRPTFFTIVERLMVMQKELAMDVPPALLPVLRARASSSASTPTGNMQEGNTSGRPCIDASGSESEAGPRSLADSPSSQGHVPPTDDGQLPQQKQDPPQLDHQLEQGDGDIELPQLGQPSPWRLIDTKVEPSNASVAHVTIEMAVIPSADVRYTSGTLYPAEQRSRTSLQPSNSRWTSMPSTSNSFDDLDPGMVSQVQAMQMQLVGVTTGVVRSNVNESVLVRKVRQAEGDLVRTLSAAWEREASRSMEQAPSPSNDGTDGT